MIQVEIAGGIRTCRLKLACNGKIWTGEKCLHFTSCGTGHYTTEDNVCLKCLKQVIINDQRVSNLKGRINGMGEGR